MNTHQVVVFKPFRFTVGEKIRIEGGPRGGDWEVIGAGERKVRLRCPISGREFEWDNFCYVTEVLDNEVWPQKD